VHAVPLPPQQAGGWMRTQMVLAAALASLRQCASYTVRMQAEVLETMHVVPDYVHLKPLTGGRSHVAGLTDVQFCHLLFNRCGKWQITVQLDVSAAKKLETYKNKLYNQLTAAHALGLKCFATAAQLPDSNLGAGANFVRGKCLAQTDTGLCQNPTTSKPACDDDRCHLHCSRRGCQAHPVQPNGRRKRPRAGGAAVGGMYAGGSECAVPDAHVSDIRPILASEGILDSFGPGFEKRPAGHVPILAPRRGPEQKTRCAQRELRGKT
jgi:hypothetical protein